MEEEYQKKVMENIGGVLSRIHKLSGGRKVKLLFATKTVPAEVINGLPGENYDTMMSTAKLCASLNPDAIKIHMLYVSDGTPIAEMYKQNRLNILSRDEYVQTVCDQLEILPMTTVIERVTGDAPLGSLLAPLWSKKKLEVQNEIDKLLFQRNSFQGIRYEQ